MNPHLIREDDEKIDGFEPKALRGHLNRIKFNWRISMDAQGWMILWLIVAVDSWR